MYKGLSKLFIIVSLAIIVSTIIAALFSYQKLHEFCICIPNKLSYAWILLAVTVLFSIISLLLSEKHSDNNTTEIKSKIILGLAIIQSACFMAGLIFLIYFAARIIDVI